MRISSAVSMRVGAMAALLIIVTGTAAGQYFRGVNVSQAEWGDPWSATYGTEYSYPSAPTFNYFAARALGFIRLQVQWERLQPVLGGPLDPTNLAYLQQDVAYAKASGALVSIVPHNQARYAPSESFVSNPCIIDNPCPGSTVNVTSADLADFWVKISNVFKDEPAVAAYDLTNQPHDMGVANWGQIAQKVLAAIRNNGDNKTIMIPGDGWSNATYWSTYNGATSFISDPAKNYYYEAHLYFDSDFSGTYAETYDQELAANAQLAIVGATRLRPFVSCGPPFLRFRFQRDLRRNLRPGAGRQCATGGCGSHAAGAVRKLVHNQQRALLSRGVRHTEQRSAMAHRAGQLPDSAGSSGYAGHVLGGGRAMGKRARLLLQLALSAAGERLHDRRGAIADVAGAPEAGFVGDGVGGRCLRVGQRTGRTGDRLRQRACDGDGAGHTRRGVAHDAAGRPGAVDR